MLLGLLLRLNNKHIKSKQQQQICIINQLQNVC